MLSAVMGTRRMSSLVKSELVARLVLPIASFKVK